MDPPRGSKLCGLFLMLAAVLLSPRGRRLSAPKMSEAADELFSKYAAEAPTTQGRLYARCWDIVNNAIAATVPAAVHDASAYDGALEVFVSAGPDDPSLIPEEQRELIAALSDTAASYIHLVEPSKLSWGSCYRTLNRPLGAYFCGISLWPRTSVDVPNFTLYFGSGSAVNPDRVFLRLEMIPRKDTDTDACYAEKYYAPFNERFFALIANDEWEPYISDSAYARGAQSPSGIRYFFYSTDENMKLASDLVSELAVQWTSFMEAAEELEPEEEASIGRRDALIRRVAADNSPDNSNRERVFGKVGFARTKALLCGDLGREEEEEQ